MSHSVAAGDLLAGTALLGVTFGSAGSFAALVVRRRLPALAGPPRLVALALIAALGLFAIHLAPAVLGVLGKPGVAVAAFVLLAAGILVPSGPPADRQPPFPRTPPSGRLSWGIAGAALGLVLVYALGQLVDHGGEAVRTVDMTTFHLPNVAGWIQSGSFWRVDDFVPYRSFGTYPNTGDVFTLAVILPYDSDFLIRFVGFPFLALTGVATYALARELTAPSAPAVLFAAALAAMPVVTFSTFEGMSDTPMLASFASGLLFLVRHGRTGSRSDLVLAGLGLGLSFGTKWYAPPAVAMTVASWTVAELLRRRSPGELMRDAATLTAIVAAVGGFWLVRNLVEVGNPVFPLNVEVAGLTAFDAPHDIQRELLGHTLAHYVGDFEVLRRIVWPALLDHMGWFAVLLWLCLPVAGVLAWLRLRRPVGRPERLRPVLLCTVIAAGIGAMYLVIPYSAQGPEGLPLQVGANARYVVPALVVAAALGAWASGRLGRTRPWFEGLALIGVLDALDRNRDVNGHVSGASFAIALVLLGVIAGGVWLFRTRPSWMVFRWRSAPGAAAVGGAVTLLLAGLAAQERRFNDHRYADAEPTARWVSTNAPASRHIGIAGDGFIVYQMFGPRLENEVEYIGPTVNGLLRAYARPRRFEAAVLEGRYDLVLVQHNDYLTPGVPERHERSLHALGYTLVASGNDAEAGGQLKTLYEAGE